MDHKSIGIISTYPNKGQKHVNFSGIAGYTKNLLLGLDDGQKSEVIVFSDIKGDSKIFTDEGIEVDECWARNKISFVRQIIGNIKKYPNLKIIHIQHEFNLFGGSLSIFLYLYLLRKIKGIDKKIVVTYHGVVSKKIINKDFGEVNHLKIPVPFIKFFFDFVYRMSAGHIDKVIVHEEYFKRVLVEDYGFKGNRVEVIRHGIEEGQPELSKTESRKIINIDQDKKVVLFFGFLAGYKGVDLLLDAFELLNKDQYFLILAGGKPKRVEKDKKYNEWYGAIEKRIANMPNILKTGFVPDEKISLYFSASDVLVLPYLQMLSASGPMSMAVSFEKPFLASDVFKEVFPEDTQLFFKCTPESLAKKISKFFSNKEKFIITSKKMRYERLWKNISNKYYKLYLDNI